jgi:peptide/nickel transport system permease protein
VIRRPGPAFGVFVLGLTALTAVAAPFVAPHSPDQKFQDFLDAPPTVVHVRDAAGAWYAPFIYRWRLVSQLEQRYEEDQTARVPLVWLSGGSLVGTPDAADAPLLLLGADSYGRDVFARLVFGARVSLGLAAVAACGALLLGAIFGAIAGYAGGTVDDALMRASEFVLVLPAMYVALALRAFLPLVLAPAAVFLILAGIFAVVGAPFVARGVRAIVRTEQQLDYATAARSLGAGHLRLVARHLLPATTGFLAVEATLLVPAFIVAEATLSFVGMGFPDAMASWGTMLQDASNIRVFTDFPWLLSPAAAMFLVVLALNLVLERADGPSASLMFSSQPTRAARR